jgi:hypothetical protein
MTKLGEEIRGPEVALRGVLPCSHFVRLCRSLKAASIRVPDALT